MLCCGLSLGRSSAPAPSPLPPRPTEEPRTSPSPSPRKGGAGCGLGWGWGGSRWRTYYPVIILFISIFSHRAKQKWSTLNENNKGQSSTLFKNRILWWDEKGSKKKNGQFCFGENDFIFVLFSTIFWRHSHSTAKMNMGTKVVLENDN